MYVHTPTSHREDDEVEAVYDEMKQILQEDGRERVKIILNRDYISVVGAE